jgi:DNA-binding transcriptional ArsR family regulator
VGGGTNPGDALHAARSMGTGAGVGAGGSIGPGLPPILEERRVADLDTLRMLTDPLRLSILGAFTTPDTPMTVKEIAEVLDEGQTKLYRHIKQLEEGGLIHVVETRVVSGIIEKRYRLSQRSLMLETDLLSLAQAGNEYRDTLLALLEATRARLSTDLRMGRVVLEHLEGGPDLSIKASGGRGMMTPERFARVREALGELTEEMDADDGKPGAVPVVFNMLLYSTAQPPARNAGAQNAETQGPGA